MTGGARLRSAVLTSLVAMALMLPAALGAEELLEEWVVCYDGPGQEPYSGDCGWAMASDQCGNVYVTGQAYGIGSHADYITIKYDSHGNELWMAVYNGPANVSDTAKAIAVDLQGNVYVTGMSGGIGTSYDFATIKYDTDGHQEWVARYDGGTYDPDRAYDIALDDSGNVYVTGNSGFSPYSDYATIKYDTDGEERWVARYDGPRNGSDWAFSIAVDNDGHVYVVGTSEGSGTGDDIATVKYDSAGREEWVARYDGPLSDDDLSYGPVRIDAAGAVYVAGTSKRGESGRDWAIIKYKPEGDQEWVAWHSGLGIAWDHPNDMLVSACGEVWVTGAVTSDATGKDLTTIKYNRLGEEAWVATYDGPGHSTDVGLSLALDSHCNVWVAGMSNGTDGDYDWVTIRHDSTGQQLAVGRYEGVGGDADVPWALVVDDEGSAYVTGKTTVIENDSDIATIKYSVVTGACEHDQAVGAILMTPNPFSRRTTVRFTITVASTPSRLDIYDVRGQLVTRLFDGRESGQQVVTWDGTDMQGVRVSSGVYFARLDSGPIHRTHKVVLLR